MANQKLEQILMTISQHGYRQTSSRKAVLSALVESGGHISADNLARRVRRTHPTVGRMTVFRTLDLMTSLGVVRPVYQGTGAAHYILMENGSHHHLICDRCSETIEFEECHSAEISRALSEQFNFRIESHLLEFHGLCESCRSC